MNFLPVLSLLLKFIGFFIYGRTIIKKTTKPAKVSWIAWWSLDVLAFASMYAKHALNYQIIAAVAGGAIIVFLALKYGEKGWTKLDVFCLAGTATGMILWWIYQEALFGIIVSQVVMFIASIPTFVSTWKRPSGENKLAWTFYCLSSVCNVGNVIFVGDWRLASCAQPIVGFICDSVITLFAFLPGKKEKLSRD